MGSPLRAHAPIVRAPRRSLAKPYHGRVRQNPHPRAYGYEVPRVWVRGDTKRGETHMLCAWCKPNDAVASGAAAVHRVLRSGRGRSEVVVRGWRRWWRRYDGNARARFERSGGVLSS
jgi:hypothetical protein